MTEPKRIPCEVYSRVVGYIRPVDSWNKGKRQEYKERKNYQPMTPEQPTKSIQ